MVTREEAHSRWNDYGIYIWYWGGYYSHLQGIGRGEVSNELTIQEREDWLQGWDDAQGDKELSDN